MTFSEIQKANDAIRTTTIQNKEYAEVNQRIKAFRMCYPEGFILTEIDSLKDGVCLMTARVGYYGANNELVILGMGHAYEKEGSTFINKTSYIENCETSAVGRALGMAGFGIDTSVASAEEVQNAMLNQKTDKKSVPLKDQKVSETNIEAMLQLCEEVHSDIKDILNYYELKSAEDMTIGTWTEAMKILEKRKSKGNTGKGKTKSA